MSIKARFIFAHVFQSGYSQANMQAKTAASCRDGGIDS
jgi:hypothetical protein